MRVLFAISFLLALTSCNQDKIAVLEKQNRELAAKLETVAQTASLENQERCSKQALSEFRNQGFKMSEANFVNHYSTSLNRCFMLVTQPTKNGAMFRTIIDAFEGKDYGDFHGEPLQKPNACYVFVDGKQVFCSSDNEFDGLIKRYMEN